MTNLNTPVAIGRYLGVMVLLFEDVEEGWVPAMFPDNEHPGRSRKKQKPLTYTGKGPDTWRGFLWANQVEIVARLPVVTE